MSKAKHCLVELSDTPSFHFDWEELRLQLNGIQFSAMKAYMPKELPATIVSSETSGVSYPLRNTNLFKKD